jgi:uncharacterized OsmC-like protein
MGITAERHDIDLEGSSARVEKTMAPSGQRRIARLDVWITLPPHLGDKERRLLQRAAEGCPVKHTLAEALPMELHWL